MNLRLLAVLGLLLLFCALPVSAAVQITAQLSNIAGNLPQTAFLRLELFNCGANFPLITGSNYTVAQPSYDFHPVNGVVSGTVFGNDEISCGGVKSTAYHVTVILRAARRAEIESESPTGQKRLHA